MAESKLHTGWKGVKGNRKPKSGSGPPGGLPAGDGTTNYPNTPDSQSSAKKGGALPAAMAEGGKSSYYIRTTDKGKGTSGGGEHNASAGRIRDVSGPTTSYGGAPGGPRGGEGMD